MARSTWLCGFAIGLSMLPSVAGAQFNLTHGALITNSCVGPLSIDPSGVGQARLGDGISCTTEITNNDEYGDMIRIDSVVNVIHHASGDVSIVDPDVPKILFSLDDFVAWTIGDNVGLGDNPLKVDATATGVELDSHGNVGLPVMLRSTTHVHLLTSCDPSIGCTDGNVCNGEETCVAGECTPGTPLVCGFCEQCVYNAGCQPLTPCCGNGVVDGDEQCDQGVAKNGIDASCCGSTCMFRSGLVCRHASSTCVHDAICTSDSDACPANVLSPPDTVCRDGDPCTLEDMCASGTCQPGTRVCDATADVAGKPKPSTAPQRILVTCMGQPLPGKEATCAAQAFVHVGAASIAAQRFAPLPRAVGRCRPDANGNVGVTRNRRRPLTGTNPTRIRLHLNGCLKMLYHRLRQSQTLQVNVPVDLSGVKKSDPESTGPDALLERIVTIARKGR